PGQESRSASQHEQDDRHEYRPATPQWPRRLNQFRLHDFRLRRMANGRVGHGPFEMRRFVVGHVKMLSGNESIELYLTIVRAGLIWRRLAFVTIRAPL